MIAGIAVGFGACLLMVAVGYGWWRKRQQAREERLWTAVQQAMEAERSIRGRANQARRALDYHRGFGDGVKWLLEIVESGEPTENPAEEAIRRSRDIYGDDG